jgi:hypothetical protein
VQQLINTYLVPTSGRSLQTTKDRILRWMQIANSPGKFAPVDATSRDIAELRRKARQNVRRLASTHPDIATEILATVKPEVVR